MLLLFYIIYTYKLYIIEVQHCATHLYDQFNAPLLLFVAPSAPF